MDNFDLKKYLRENKLTTNSKPLSLTEATDKIDKGDGVHVLVSDFVKKHIETHNEIGIGSVFKKGADIKQIQDLIKSTKVTGDGGAYTVKMSGIGYNLVLPMDKAEKLPDAQKTKVKKKEGPNEVEVNAIKTSAPLSQFTTDQLTLIIRPSNPQYLPDDVKNNDEIKKAIEDKKSYSLLTAFPGDPNIPRASEWDDKYAVIIPDQKLKENLNKNTMDNFDLRKYLTENKLTTNSKSLYLTEVLDNVTDPQSASEFIKEQLDEYFETIEDYGMGYMVEEKLEKLLGLVTKKLKPGTSFEVKDDYRMDSNEYGESSIEGTIKVNGTVVVDYESHGDGYGFSAEVDQPALENELKIKLTERVEGSITENDDIDENLYFDFMEYVSNNVQPRDAEYKFATGEDEDSLRDWTEDLVGKEIELEDDGKKYKYKVTKDMVEYYIDKMYDKQG